MQRTQWTDEKIEAGLRQAAAALGTFPSSQELRAVGRNDLACIVSKRGGYLHWADKLGLPRTASDSDFGWQGEVAMLELLRGQGFNAERQSAVKAPFDILVNDVFRIDVKTASFASYGPSRGWFYRIGKIPQADLIVLYQADTEAFYGLPWTVCPRSNVTISVGGGKYANYLNNWSLVREMVGLRMAERLKLLGGVPVAEVA